MHIPPVSRESANKFQRATSVQKTVSVEAGWSGKAFWRNYELEKVTLANRGRNSLYQRGARSALLGQCGGEEGMGQDGWQDLISLAALVSCAVEVEFLLG